MLKAALKATLNGSLASTHSALLATIMIKWGNPISILSTSRGRNANGAENSTDANPVNARPPPSSAPNNEKPSEQNIDNTSPTDPANAEDRTNPVS